MFNKKILAASAAISMAFAGSAYAQPEAPTAPAAPSAAAPAPAAQQVEVSDEQVKEFTKVYQEVSAISQAYQGQLQATNDPEEVAAISQQANEEMVAVVEQSQLSVEEYNQYAMLLQQDKDFQKKFMEHAK